MINISPKTHRKLWLLNEQNEHAILLLKNIGVVAEPVMMNTRLNIDIGKSDISDNFFDRYKDIMAKSEAYALKKQKDLDEK